MANAQSAAPMPPGNFNANTRQSWIQMNPFPFVAGGVLSQQLTQVGFLSRIIVPITVNFTTASTGTYANSLGNPPTPYGFVRRLRLITNEGQELHSTSGYGNYLRTQIMRTALDPRNPVSSFNSTNTAAAVYNIPASYTTSTAYTITFYMYVDVAWTDSLYQGLIFLQNPTNRLSLEITWGDATTLLTLGGTTPSITVNSVLCSPYMEMFNVPQDPRNWPSLSFAHMVIEDSTNNINGTGDIVYRPILGNQYLSVISAFTNNNANMVPANFSLKRITYQGTQNAYSITPTNQLIIQRMRYAHDLPDGVFVDDFRMGVGLPELPSTRDAIATANVTDFQMITTIGSGVTITQPANLMAVREMLAPLTYASGSSG